MGKHGRSQACAPIRQIGFGNLNLNAYGVGDRGRMPPCETFKTNNTLRKVRSHIGGEFFRQTAECRSLKAFALYRSATFRPAFELSKFIVALNIML